MLHLYVLLTLIILLWLFKVIYLLVNIILVLFMYSILVGNNI